MAKIRAYKIAEELGLDRDEFIKKAGEVGIPLRSPMVALEPERADELRARLGGGEQVKREEKRVGSSVIRRRRTVVKPEPPPKVEEAPQVVEETPSVVEGPVTEAPEPVAAEVVSGPTPGIEPTVEPEPEPVTPAPSAPPTEAAPIAAKGEPPAPPPKRLVRRQAIAGIQMREQETLARMLRGNVQSQLERRRQIVEQQSRIQSRRRRPAGGAPARKPIAGAPKKKVVKLEGPISFQDLSRQMGVKLQELLHRAHALGSTEADREELLEAETAALIAADLGFEVQTVERGAEGVAPLVETEEKDLEPRPPVVTVMGHVDHGKTSLLDTIRKANVVAGEVGGITQHVGAYKVQAGDLEITFLDTPGHEAFTQMRARGAQVTDIAVLVVAADDGIMPQTVEAIAHAKAAGVPIIVAVNKIDLPDANPQRAKQALLEHGLVPEDFGGDTICVEVSATQGTNVDKLLEMIGLQSEILETRARRSGPAVGTVVEARLDKGRGPIATVLVREGTLRRGDGVVVGTTYGRVRTLLDERGEMLKEAGPATPAQVVGLSGVPDSGDDLVVVGNERQAKQIVDSRLEEQRRDETQEPTLLMDADQLFASVSGTDEKQLRVVLKADVHGTMEAIRDSLEKLSTEKVKLSVIHCGVGAITESDVMLASASQATVVGFHVRPEPAARRAAEAEEVDIRTYQIVYEVLEDMTGAMKGLLPPQVTERLVASAEVRKIFTIPRVGTIAGSYVSEGTFARANRARVVRDGVIIYSGRLSSLRRFKDDVREVAPGLECGIAIENFNDIKVGDTLESFVAEESPPTL
jgi:translation initiation factor IF-2